MEIIKLNQENSLIETDFNKLVSAIKVGGVVVLPTDTVYGFSALAKNKKAVGKIYTLKKRDKHKPLIVLMKSFCMLRRFCYLNNYQYIYLKNRLEKGDILTVILKARQSSLNHLINKNGGLAVRIPRQSKLLMSLIKELDEPIVSTSLNISGETELIDLNNFEKKFNKSKVKLILDKGEIKKTKTSEILDIRDINKILSIRR